MHTVTRAAAVAATLTAIALAAPSAAQADRIPVDEGGDTASCVTYPEFMAVHFGESRGEVRRAVDTDGHRISADFYYRMIVPSVQTVPGTEVAVPKHVMVRHYLGCQEPNGDIADVYVEFNTTTDRMTGEYWD
jgi:hypothetical protein